MRDGWLFTGDLGYVDGEGYLYLVDRKKDMIDTGGVKIYPKDVEEVAARHPGVREVAVFGVPHERWGETPVAAVVLRAGASSSRGRTARLDQRARRGALPARRRGADHGGFSAQRRGQDLKREMRAAFWEGRDRKIQQVDAKGVRGVGGCGSVVVSPFAPSMHHAAVLGAARRTAAGKSNATTRGARANRLSRGFASCCQVTSGTTHQIGAAGSCSRR